MKKLSVSETLKTEKQRIFSPQKNIKNPLKASFDFSVLTENLIRKLAGNEKRNFAVASAGSFSRRELSPYSDIDLMFIVDKNDDYDEDISKFITTLWDNGIEVSHTVRTLQDVDIFFEEDLHSFTTFFETRLLFGNIQLYNLLLESVKQLLTDENKLILIKLLHEDILNRYRKFGSSPKVIEPNIKQTAGGLRDFQFIEWIYILQNGEFINNQQELSQAEIFIKILEEKEYTTPEECKRLLNGYSYILSIRNLLHIIHQQKYDRLEFEDQIRVASYFYESDDGYRLLMKNYFESSNVIFRFCRSYRKRITLSLDMSFKNAISVDLDDDFIIKGKIISCKHNEILSHSDILRAFYYRALHDGSFDEKLRMLIIDSLDKKGMQSDVGSSVFFRELMKLPTNVGKTLSIMNELGVLGAFLPEFNDLNGFIQHGVYHNYTADEHTIITIQNVENLVYDKSELGRIYRGLKNRDILFLGLLFHDIAKPISISGHEVIGAEIALSVLSNLGYSEDEIEQIQFLVRNHLLMEHVAFRRNLNDPETLNNFVSKFSNVEQLELLYLLTYADLSAVNPALWTSWKNELLSELFRKAKIMIEDKITGEALLVSSTSIIPENISQHSDIISNEHVKDHIESMNDIGYTSHFSEAEIAKHIEKINSGAVVSVLFKEMENFTNITVITKDSPFLLSKLCGVLSINDLNIHDAKIFTRKDQIVIDNFNVTDFRTHRKIEKDRFEKIEDDFNQVISGMLQLSAEMKKMKSRWWRIETKFFKRTGQIKIKFEEHEKYTIIDISSPDRLGFLHHVTGKMNELGLNIHFAKIATKGDDIIDSFYVLDRNNKKVSSNFYPFIEEELTEAIKQIL